MLVAAAVLLLLAVGGCGTKARRSGGIPGSKPYTVYGRTYYPLKSARGFTEEGIASWYGPGFHGKKTANGEIYNMHAMTAAHRILPLGSIVRVHNRRNGRSLVLRINDRGPFADDRVIDLSRAAAEKLGVIGEGTAPVRITAMHDGLPEGGSGSGEQARKMNRNTGGRLYLQVGAYPEKEDAQEMARQMEALGYRGRYLFAERVKRWRVQIGPLSSREVALNMKERLADSAHDAFIVIDD
jgi:rare lipoprotein A